MSALVTGDPEGAKAFYGAVFGWETEGFQVGEDQFFLFRLPGYVGGEPEQPVARDVVAAMAPAPPGTAAHWSVDFWVDDVDAAAARAASHGGGIVVEPQTTPLGREATLADPAGGDLHRHPDCRGRLGAGLEAGQRRADEGADRVEVVAALLDEDRREAEVGERSPGGFVARDADRERALGVAGRRIDAERDDQGCRSARSRPRRQLGDRREPGLVPRAR